MRSKQYLTRSEDFDRVYRNSSSRRDWASRLIAIRAAPNSLDFSRYGYSISKKVGGAVVRNLIRRRLRKIMRLTPLKPGWDIVIIVRSGAAPASFSELRESMADLLLRAKLTVTENEVHSVKAD